MKKKSLLDLYRMREKGEKATWITAYDALTASLAEQVGMDMLLVGDSVGMCVYGYGSTNQMSMAIMLEHTKAVRRGAPNTFVIGDMPFLSYQVSNEEAVKNAGAFVQQCEADAIKLEGGVRVADRIKAIADSGIVVFGHIGLTPQSSGKLGGFKAQGLTAESAKDVIADAKAVEGAGASALLVEAVAPEVTQVIHEMLSIPVYSIGAGPLCDGQLLIVADLLGSFEAFTPKFVKKYANLSKVIKDALVEYCDEVRKGEFPTPKHVYNMKEGELEKLRKELGK